MTHRHRNITATAAAVLIAAAAQLCASCSSCGRGDGTKTATDSTTLAATPEAILEGPLALDPEALHSYAAAVHDNATFDEADIAHVIRLTEGAFSHLLQELEQLQANDDAADSFHVLNELAKSGWPDDTSTLLSFLRAIPLPANMQQRTDQLVRTAARCMTLLDEISTRQHGGKQYLKINIDPLKK